MKAAIYALHLPSELYDEVRKAAGVTNLSLAEAMRQSIKFGLPTLCEKLAPGRVTNVPPLPDEVARTLYTQPDDDVEGIEAFMKAQPKAVQE